MNSRKRWQLVRQRSPKMLMTLLFGSKNYNEEPGLSLEVSKIIIYTDFVVT